MDHFLQKTENVVFEKLLPAFTGRNGDKTNQRLFVSLSLNNDGLNIVLPKNRSRDNEASHSKINYLNQDDSCTAETSQYKFLRSLEKYKSTEVKKKS